MERAAGSSSLMALFAWDSDIQVLPHHFGPRTSTAPNASRCILRLPSMMRGR